MTYRENIGTFKLKGKYRNKQALDTLGYERHVQTIQYLWEFKAVKNNTISHNEIF